MIDFVWLCPPCTHQTNGQRLTNWFDQTVCAIFSWTFSLSCTRLTTSMIYIRLAPPFAPSEPNYWHGTHTHTIVLYLFYSHCVWVSSCCASKPTILMAASWSVCGNAANVFGTYTHAGQCEMGNNITFSGWGRERFWSHFGARSSQLAKCNVCVCAMHDEPGIWNNNWCYLLVWPTQFPLREREQIANIP